MSEGWSRWIRLRGQSSRNRDVMQPWKSVDWGADRQETVKRWDGIPGEIGKESNLVDPALPPRVSGNPVSRLFVPRVRVRSCSGRRIGESCGCRPLPVHTSDPQPPASSSSSSSSGRSSCYSSSHSSSSTSSLSGNSMSPPKIWPHQGTRLAWGSSVTLSDCQSG